MDGVDVYDLEYPTYEGVRLAKVEPLLRDAGKVINDIQDLKLGPEAVILATFPRSGTHWVYEITHMLLTGNANYNTVSREATFLEGLPDLGPLQFYNHIVSTHLQFKWLPKQHVERGGKIIYVIRNPKDVAVSFFEVLRNTLKELKRLAEFLEVKIADPLLKEIAEKCQFDNLKTADKSVRNDEALSKIMRAVSLNEHPTIYRKGEIGDWKNYFTVAMSEAFDKANADNMDDIGLEFEFE
ncbi:sulfotransferase 1C4-like [Magallana gigas]|uniref:sulfotransferase 1C4-like n=1 Tax=Magallana gigas TaxID=29159 RepID=UPI00333FB8C9